MHCSTPAQDLLRTLAAKFSFSPSAKYATMELLARLRQFWTQQSLPSGMESMDLEQFRLDKIISAQGEYSRRDVKKLAQRGAITVNGKVVKRAEKKIDPDCDQVCVNGKMLVLRTHVYLMLHKPQGVVSASRDTSEKTVVDLVPPAFFRKGLFPAGRLDKDTTGFVLITDDGELAHRILSPRNHVPKTYIAVLDHPISQEHIERFASGILLDGDTLCKPALLSPEPDWPEQPAARVVLREGMYHQIKRMFSSMDIQVVALHRIAIGGVALDPHLKVGDCRELTPEEKLLLECRD